MNRRAWQHLRTDPVLAPLIERIGPLQLEPRRLPPFQALTQAIIHQQLSGKAAGTILNRFLVLYGNGSFPAAEAVRQTAPEQLRAVGMSRPKAGYVLDIARKAAAGEIPSLVECDALSDEELVARLTEIKGVGRWTVEMLLIFNLGRTDVLPVDDLGVRKGCAIVHRKRALPAPEQLARLGQRWAPFRSFAALYLWRATDTPE